MTFRATQARKDGVTSAPTTLVRVERAALGIALRVAAMACFACLSAVVKWSGGRGIPTFEIVFFRNVFAFVPLGIYIWRTTGLDGLKTKRPLGHLTRSGIGLTSMVCGFSALQRLPLTDATAFQFAAPLFMTALSAVMLREQVGRHRWGAVLVGFIGVLIMTRPTGQVNAMGVGLALAAAVCTAGAHVTIREISATERGATIVFYFTLAGVVLGLAGCLFAWKTPDALTFAMLVLGGLVGGVGQILLTQAVTVAPVGVVAPFDYTQLVWATLFSLMIWGELPHPATVAGALVVAASGVYILHREIRRFRLNR